MEQQKISHERAIENLMVSYAYANDDADIKLLGSLYKDAVFHIDEVSAKGSGEIEAIAGSMIQIMENGRSATTHEIMNIIIEIDKNSETATGRAYFTLYKTVSGNPREAIMSGRYADKFFFDQSWHWKERKASILWKL